MAGSSTVLWVSVVVPLLLGSLLQKETVAFTFNSLPYVHRHSEGTLHEFTPKGQKDLDKWTQMVTVNRYPKVKDGESLADAANAVLEAYKKHEAIVVKTNSLPRTKDRPAEHLIVVLFARPKFIEAAFARFKMDGPTGVSIVFSHRVYGDKAGDAMGGWIEKNGPLVEKQLMAMKTVPKPK